MSTEAELLQLIDRDIADGRRHLQDSHNNLEKVAAYCEGNYLQTQEKRHALEETKNYTTQSLASVAYQINTLATNFLHLLDLQSTQLKEMESSINHLSQTVMIHKEKVARREIGVLTTNKTTSRPQGVKNPGIIFPEQPERPVKYVRKPIDYTVLDEIGHGVKAGGQQNTRNRRASSGSSKSSAPSSAGQAPTSKPPTPPQMRGSNSGGTLTRQASSPYRTPAPPVSPPSVPSNYAPSYIAMQRQISQQQQAAAAAAAQGPRAAQQAAAAAAHAQVTSADRRSGYAPVGNIQVAQVPPTLPGGVIPPSSIAGTHPGGPPSHHPSAGPNISIPQGGVGSQPDPSPPPPPMPANVAQKTVSQRQESYDSFVGSDSDNESYDMMDYSIPAKVYRKAGVKKPTDPPPPPMPEHNFPGRMGNVSPPLPPPPGGDRSDDIPPPPPNFGGPLSGGPGRMPPGAGFGLPQHPGPGAQYGMDRFGGGGHLPPGSMPGGAPMSHGVPLQSNVNEWVPKNYLEKVVAIYDYIKDKEDELTFSEGSTIYVIKKNDDGWYEGVMDGVTGLFPGNYVEPCM